MWSAYSRRQRLRRERPVVVFAACLVACAAYALLAYSLIRMFEVMP